MRWIRYAFPGGFWSPRRYVRLQLCPRTTIAAPEVVLMEKDTSRRDMTCNPTYREVTRRGDTREAMLRGTLNCNISRCSNRF